MRVEVGDERERERGFHKCNESTDSRAREVENQLLFTWCFLHLWKVTSLERILGFFALCNIENPT